MAGEVILPVVVRNQRGTGRQKRSPVNQSLALHYTQAGLHKDIMGE